jgi:hypothetical protein
LPDPGRDLTTRMLHQMLGEILMAVDRVRQLTSFIGTVA